MAEVTETTTRPADGHSTIVVDDRKGMGAGGMLLLGVVILLAILLAVWMFSGQNASEIAKDDAIADAASQVGNAAENVGDAAGDAAAAVGDTTSNAASSAADAADRAAEAAQ